MSTKCIRVSSDATSQDVIDTLIEKFRPDMRMLSTPRFALYEIHESGGGWMEGLESVEDVEGLGCEAEIEVGAVGKY